MSNSGQKLRWESKNLSGFRKEFNSYGEVGETKNIWLTKMLETHIWKENDSNFKVLHFFMWTY